MATLERPAQGSGSQVATGGGGGAPPPTGDGLRVHPFLYPYPAKTTDKAKLSKQLERLAAPEHKRQARAFLAALDEARGAAVAAVESSAVSAEGCEAAVREYLALLQGLVGGCSSAAASSSPAAADSMDAELEQAEAGQGAGGLAVDSKLRTSASFTWTDALIDSASASASDVLFELASILLAAVLAAARQAAKLCEDSASGVSTAASTQAYKLLRSGAGTLDWLASAVLPQLPPTASQDLDPKVVACLSGLLLADAQSLTVLRAVAKNSAPTLVASLALDTAGLYRGAADQLAHCTAPAAAASKLAQYLAYKRWLHEAYAQLHSGLEAWGRDAPGQGLRALAEAATAMEAAKRAASAFDAAAPATLNLSHRRHDELLSDKLAASQRRMRRDAEAVHFQSVAKECPPLPAPRRLASPLPFALPAPAAALRDGALDCFAAGQAPPPVANAASTGLAAASAAGGAGAGTAGAGAGAGAPAGAAAGVAGAADPKPAAAGGDAGAEQGCSCWRWALFLLVMPLLAAISLLGVVVWLLLLPVKVLCCPVGCLVQLLYNVVEGLVKMPLRWAAWAAGKPWQRAPPPQSAAPAVAH